MKICKAMLLGFVLIQNVYAQKTWTLDECVEYAINHNIDVLKQTELITQKEIQLNTAKNVRLPKFNAELEDDFAFYNRITKSVATIPNNLSSSVSFMSLQGSFNASMPLIDAGGMTHKKKAAEYSLESALAMLEQAQKDVGIQVAVYYLKALSAKGMVNVGRKQVELSKSLLKRAEIMVNEGSKPESELVMAKAQLASDEYQLSVDEGNERMATIMLAQLLALNDVASFKVDDPSLSKDVSTYQMPEKASLLYESTIDQYPAIRAAKADINAAESQLKIEKSNKYPSLDLIGSITTQGFDIYNKDYSSRMPSFLRQLRDFHNEIIGIRVKIPVFSGYQTRNAIRLAQSNVAMKQLDLSGRNLQLRTEIEQAYYNAEIALARHNAAIKAELTAHTNYDYQVRSYEAGRSTIFDLNKTTQQWICAQQNVVESRYDYLIRLKIIDFYMK